MLCLQKRPSRLLVTAVREQRFQFCGSAPDLARVRQEVTRAVKEHVHDEGNNSMKRCPPLLHEHKCIAAIEKVILVGWRLNASGLMPNPGVRDVVAAEPHSAGPRAPVSLLPIGKVVFIEEANG